MKEAKAVSVTPTQVKTTQFDSLNTNLPDNMNLSDSSHCKYILSFSRYYTYN